MFYSIKQLILNNKPLRKLKYLRLENTFFQKTIYFEITIKIRLL